MEVDALTILQGIGSGRIKKQDFIVALLSDEGTKEFLQKYNSDGKWSSVWKGTEKIKENSMKKESLKETIRRIIKEENKKNQFDKSEFNKILDDALTDLYHALNKIEDIIPNYLKLTGQNGLIGTFHKDIKLKELKNIIDVLERLSK